MSVPGDIRALAEGSKQDWQTPPDLFALLNAEFRFTLDAAASDKNHLCTRYITEAENALTADPIDDVIFCNPPYGRGMLDWAEAFARWAVAGSTVVALVPNATETAWFEHMWAWSTECRFLAPRVRFVDPATGKPGNSNTAGSCIFIYRPSLIHSIAGPNDKPGLHAFHPPRCIHWRWLV